MTAPQLSCSESRAESGIVRDGDQIVGAERGSGTVTLRSGGTVVQAAREVNHSLFFRKYPSDFSVRFGHGNAAVFVADGLQHGADARNAETSLVLSEVGVGAFVYILMHTTAPGRGGSSGGADEKKALAEGKGEMQFHGA